MNRAANIGVDMKMTIKAKPSKGQTMAQLREAVLRAGNEIIAEEDGCLVLAIFNTGDQTWQQR